jgi:tetratricopeptide (TPR) repeat protein
LILFFISCGPTRKKSKEEILEEKAEYYYKKEIYKEAIPYYDQLINIDSTKGKYYYNRGYCYGRLFYWEFAYSNYQKAIKLKYRVADAYFDIGLIFSVNEQDSLALVYYDKSLKLDSSRYQGIQILKRISKSQIEFRKNNPEAWKEFEEFKKRKKLN